MGGEPQEFGHFLPWKWGKGDEELVDSDTCPNCGEKIKEREGEGMAGDKKIVCPHCGVGL